MNRTTITITTTCLAAVLAGGAVTLAQGDDTAVPRSIVLAQDDEPTPGTAAGDLEQAADAAITEVGDGDVTSVEHDSGGFDVDVRRPDGTEVEVWLDDQLAVVGREDDGLDTDDRDEGPVSRDDLRRASETALAEVGDGTVTSVERDDGGFDVDVRRPDGTEIEVRLDDQFTVVGTENDGRDDGNDRDDDDRDDD